VPKDTYYLKHDTNAAHDPKIEALIHHEGMAGYGRFWRLVEMLREQEKGKMRRDKWCLSMLARNWKCSPSRVSEFLDAMIQEYELIVADDDYIWSERICRDMESLEKRRQEAQNAASMRWHRGRNADA